MEVFELNDYRNLMVSYLDGEATQSRGKRTLLSEKLGVHTSHLSQVMAGKRSLTPDQALILSRLLGLSSLETEYLMTLIHQERAASFEFKKYCTEKLNQIRAQSKKTAELFPHQKKLSEQDQAKFYSHYLYSAIRLFCSIGNKGQLIEDLENRFLISREKLMPMIRFLLKAGLLTEQNGHYKMGIASTFLSRESPHIHRHHANWRMLATHQSPRLEEDELMFTAPMSISRKDFHRIREMLLKEIGKISPLIQESPAEEIACLNLDLYWIKK